MKNRNLAIIPARSGSKGLVDKNIKLLNGKPLLAYTIEAAKESECFSVIHVSTDSKEYGDIGEKYGANVPFFRGIELSSDTASTWDVVRYVLNQYKEKGMEFDTVCVLQPTSPLRTSEDIINGYRLKKENAAKAIVSVCEMDHSPLWSNVLPEDKNMSEFIRKEAIKLPRQQLPTYYRINGALYIVDVNTVEKGEDIYSVYSYAYIMPKERSVDIDDKIDFLMAESIIKVDY